MAGLTIPLGTEKRQAGGDGQRGDGEKLKDPGAIDSASWLER